MIYDSETNNNINIGIINTIKQDKDTSRLLKRRHLKGKKVVILKDMARDLAKRLKKLKEKHSVDSAWFTNGRINYKLIKG